MKQQALWTKFENHLLNEGISRNRQLKLKSMFICVEKYLGTTYEKAQRIHVESFINKLNRNEILSEKGKAYSGRTKQDIKKFLRQFYKWLKGNNESYPKQVSWLKTKISKDEKAPEKEVISFEELRKLIQYYEKIEYRALALLLFDSGFRIQEMLSVRKKDFTWEDFDEKNKCFWIKCNVSKTIPRKVPIPLFTEDLQQIRNSSWFKNLNDDDLLFNMNYDAINERLKRSSIKVFGVDKEGKPIKKLTAHNFRHSSATYYAKQYDGNMNLIGERYGWSFDSKELKTYIRRSGVYQKAGVKKVYANETGKLKQEIQSMQEQNKKLQDEMEFMKKIINKIAEKNEDLADEAFWDSAAENADKLDR